MIGVEIESAEAAKHIATRMMEHRIILNRTSDTVLRFLPPYILTREHVDIAIKALDEILTDMTSLAGQKPVGGHTHG